MAKRVYPYFNVNLSRTGTPPRPTWVYLGRGHASVSKPKQLQAGKYTFNISYRFYVGHDGYYWWWPDCAKDTETTDGLGLPGSHSCGVKRVSSTVSYLG